MAEYMVRVEIYKANSEGYEELHKALEMLGMKRTVQGDSKLLKMPDGTYFGTSSLTAEQLRKRIHEMARPFSHPSDPSIFVSQSVDWSAWLKPA